jgi:23S rRNA (cytosine1962-C5)-methyltransferase
MYNSAMDTIHTLVPIDWPDYELIDSGNERKLERFGKYILNRPDNQALWKPALSEQEWQKADAEFRKNGENRGEWRKRNGSIPNQWEISYKNLRFSVRLTPFGHIGIFPEQAPQWEWITNKLKGKNEKLKVQNNTDNQADSNKTIQHYNNLSVLSLFTYTGVATLAAALAGAQVTHVDASHPAVTWAHENQLLSGLEQKPIRWIVDDALKFAKREIRRGSKYDGIILDPPKFGRGPKGELWKFEESMPELIDVCKQILKPDGFVIATAYAIPISSETLKNMLTELKPGKTLEYGELMLQERSGRKLPAALYTRG